MCSCICRPWSSCLQFPPLELLLVTSTPSFWGLEILGIPVPRLNQMIISRTKEPSGKAWVMCKFFHCAISHGTHTPRPKTSCGVWRMVLLDVPPGEVQSPPWCMQSALGHLSTSLLASPGRRAQHDVSPCISSCSLSVVVERSRTVGQPNSVNLITQGQGAGGTSVKMYIVSSELGEYLNVTMEPDSL